jgi:hypothetical protein
MDGHALGQRFIGALRAADFDTLGGFLAPQVQLLALLPGGLVASFGRAAVVERLRGFLDDGAGFAVRAAEAVVVGHRLRLSYLVEIPGPDGPAVMEQQAYCVVSGEAIAAIRLLCSGGMPAAAA